VSRRINSLNGKPQATVSSKNANSRRLRLAIERNAVQFNRVARSIERDMSS